MELTIEKLVYGGDGLARLPSEEGQRAKTVFVPYVLPAERVNAAVVEERPGFARARLEQVLQASPLRVQSPCPYFGQCGGCHYQHTSYQQQLSLKSEILRETLRRTAKIELSVEIQIRPSPPLHYRNRTRFHVRSRPNPALGYFRHASHELLQVRECPISSPLINRALTGLWLLAESSKLPSAISEIELFANASDERLMVEIHLQLGFGATSRESLLAFSRDLQAAVPGIHSIVSFARANPRSRSAIEPKREVLSGDGVLTYEVAGVNYRVSAGAFFQTNRFLAQNMIEAAIGDRKGRIALDLYSGVGLFAAPLARRFDRVIAVEPSSISASDLRANAPANVKVSAQSAENYLTSVAGTLRPDLIVVDPPRAGLGAGVCAQIESLAAQQIAYVSCDPATLARDLKQLTSSGLRVSEMRLLDLFPQTFHIETCTLLKRD